MSLRSGRLEQVREERRRELRRSMSVVVSEWVGDQSLALVASQARRRRDCDLEIA